MTKARHPVYLGIMVSRWSAREGERANPPPLQMPEDLFCRQLCRIGRKLGIDVYLFDASGSPDASGITGYALGQKEWLKTRLPLPDIVYDRTLCTSAKQLQLRARLLSDLKQNHPFILMNGSLPDKWNVHTLLQQDGQLRPFLVPTVRYEGTQTLTALDQLQTYGLFLKPAAGTHGKGAIHLFPSSSGYELTGRDRCNNTIAFQFHQLQEAEQWLQRFTFGIPYLVQPYLRLTGENGRPFDVRALIQKNSAGRWSFTGAALREGGEGSVTSNLHGGGRAVMASESLTVRFGKSASDSLLAQIRRISERAAHRLEQHCGRLAEIGFDFGIEPDGRLWLLEANAKPGRLAFAGDSRAASTAVLQPLRYARWLAGRRNPVFSPDNRIALQTP
ncbi:YheC/YheD family endospore coat-associated protein [Paenibacillus nasutitermitis]|uniref:ATP-grasp domain-containing protein n=1 Tax=Paenibacillus nasutitermitis TaxID=1652958 RepID=A0A916Z4I3_9BACL|nr:YheC/YheD family protein [Paenibacillus nasutitermitis]GGD74203.1 hypothetical protein GCM10010911_35140 [Paenibacillus nasutitermitis]